jgi:hypothetical protein
MPALRVPDCVATDLIFLCGFRQREELTTGVIDTASAAEPTRAAAKVKLLFLSAIVPNSGLRATHANRSVVYSEKPVARAIHRLQALPGGLHHRSGNAAFGHRLTDAGSHLVQLGIRSHAAAG